MIRKILVWILIVTLNWNGFAWAAGPPPPQAETPLTYKQALQRLDRFMALVEELRSSIDRSQFDLGALLDKFDYNADKIIKFVKEDIYFEQYPGLLRGARGTLMSRAGNSLDQAVLLARLLKDAGYEARIARSTLSAVDAKVLIEQMLVLQRASAPIGNRAALDEVLEKIGKLLRNTSTPANETSYQSIATSSEQLIDVARKHADAIRTTLQESGLKFGYPSDLAGLAIESQDYFWVEYRPDPTKDWAELHPAFASSGGPTRKLPPEVVYSRDIPHELQHRVRVEAFVERRLGSRLETYPLMSPWERPAANLISAPITYTNLFNEFSRVSTWSKNAVFKAAQNSTLFFPVLNGKIPEGAKAFDLQGNVIDSITAGSMMAGVFQKLGSSFQKATSQMQTSGIRGDSMDSPANPAMTLEQHWLEITLIAPTGKEKVFRRILWEKRTNDPADIDTLAQEVTLSINVGKLPAAYVLDTALTKLQEIGSIVRKGLNPGGASSPLEAEQLEVETPNNVSYSLEALAFFFFSGRGRTQAPYTLSYRSEPSVFARYRHFWVFDGLFQGVDIVNNTQRTFVAKNGRLVFSPLTNLYNGVWDSIAETLVVPSGQGSISSIGTLFDKQPGPYRSKVKLISEMSQLEGLKYKNRARMLISEDLKDGYVVILPQQSAAENSALAWWRVHLETGETLRVTSLGWGGFVTEDVELRSLSAVVTKQVAARAWKCNLAFNAVYLGYQFGKNFADGLAPLDDSIIEQAISYITRLLGGPGTTTKAYQEWMNYCVFKL